MSDIRELHAKGQSMFVGDIPCPTNTLHAAVVPSPIANGILVSVNSSAAEAMPGVVRIITAKDIPGCNEIGDIVPGETLLAEKSLNFIGKPVALVLATSEQQARRAAASIKVTYDELAPIANARTAYQQDHTFGDMRHFSNGDTKNAFDNAFLVVEGSTETPAQEHLYFETQRTLAIPIDNNKLKVFSASQNPSGIQKFVARVLDIDMNHIEVEVPRLGGGFGGKEEQAKPWALLACLGTYLTKRPVRLVLSREEDMSWTGKRHPYSADYRLATDKDGHITAYEVTFFQDGGAVADLSTAVLERTLFHATNAYGIENTSIKAISCRTSHPSNTAFRGFGAPQAIFTLECAIDHAARELKRPAHELQLKNLFAAGYRFPYGMIINSETLRDSWATMWQEFNVSERLSSIESFNRNNSRYKKGMAVLPLCFGIAFTATHLNQASAQVSIYVDGSIHIACSAVEMGQGVNEKMVHIVSEVFKVTTDRITVSFSNSSKTPNMSPTAASVGADLNGMAVLEACRELENRLLKFASALLGTEVWKVAFDPIGAVNNDNHQSIPWNELISQAYLQRISLSEHAFYATDNLYFDKSSETGNPFAYHTLGCSVSEATVDTMLGTYTVDKLDVVYDLGPSLALSTDLGQMEGGLVQGVGYCTTEEITYDENMRVQNQNFSTYKIPDLLSSPDIQVIFTEKDLPTTTAFNSKAVGEPPFLLGLGAYFAIRQAMAASSLGTLPAYSLPITPEKVLTHLYPSHKNLDPNEQ